MENTFNVKINNEVLTFSKKVKILDLIKDNKHQYINASVNNRLRELNYEVFYDCEIDLYTKKDYYAIKIYETSLRYIIAMACSRAFPKYKVKFSYNISRSIYLTICSTKGQKSRSFTNDEALKLKETIDDIIKKDYPLIRKVVPNEEAKVIYKEKHISDNSSSNSDTFISDCACSRGSSSCKCKHL